MKIHMSNSEGIEYLNYCIIMYSPSFTTLIKNIKRHNKIILQIKYILHYKQHHL